MTGWDPDRVRLDLARDLREVVRLYSLLPGEARASLREPSEIEALSLAGPAANLEAWQHRYDAAEADGRDTSYVYEQCGELHPLLVLGTWEDVVRDERGQPTDLRATVPRAAEYLRGSIDWMLGVDECGDLNFLAIDQLADDLRSCLRHLEDVLSEGVRADLSRVWCITGSAAHQDRKVRLRRIWGALEGADVWECPVCRERYDYGAYISAMRVNLHSQGAERFVTVSEAKAALGLPEQTIRSWMRRGTVQTARDASRRLCVWWPDARHAATRVLVHRARMGA